MSEDRFKKLVIPHVDAIKKENRAELLERFLSQVTERSSSSHDRTPDDTRIVASDVDPFSRATFLLKCHVSYGCRRHDLYHYSDSGKHLKCLQFSRRSDIDVCSKVAQDVLKLLQLPVDTPYATISRKIVCQCGQPKFVQPASFTDLVRIYFSQLILLITKLTIGHRLPTSLQKMTGSTLSPDHAGGTPLRVYKVLCLRFMMPCL